MDLQTLLNVGFGVASSVIAWFARELWYATKEMRADVSKLREEIAKDYVTKIDFKEALADVRAILQRIYDKLDDKADKP